MLCAKQTHFLPTIPGPPLNSVQKDLCVSGLLWREKTSHSSHRGKKKKIHSPFLSSPSLFLSHTPGIISPRHQSFRVTKEILGYECAWQSWAASVQRQNMLQGKRFSSQNSLSHFLNSSLASAPFASLELMLLAHSAQRCCCEQEASQLPDFRGRLWNTPPWLLLRRWGNIAWRHDGFRMVTVLLLWVWGVVRLTPAELHPPNDWPFEFGPRICWGTFAAAQNLDESPAHLFVCQGVDDRVCGWI